MVRRRVAVKYMLGNRCYTIIFFTWFTVALLSILGSRKAADWDMAACLFDEANASSYECNASESDVAIIFSLVLTVWAVLVAAIIYATVIFNAVIRAQQQIIAQVISIGGHVAVVRPIPSPKLHSIRSGKNMLVICFVVFILTNPAAITLVVVSMERLIGTNLQ